jgi:hypothetical protein
MPAFFDICLFEFTFLDFSGTLLIFGFNFMNGFLKTRERMKNLNQSKINLKTEL